MYCAPQHRYPQGTRGFVRCSTGIIGPSCFLPSQIQRSRGRVPDSDSVIAPGCNMLSRRPLIPTTTSRVYCLYCDDVANPPVLNDKALLVVTLMMRSVLSTYHTQHQRCPHGAWRGGRKSCERLRTARRTASRSGTCTCCTSCGCIPRSSRWPPCSWGRASYAPASMPQTPYPPS